MKTTKFICPRCKPTLKSRSDCNVPCPRGGCEAIEVEVPNKTFTSNQVEKLINKFAKSIGVPNPGHVASGWCNENL